jgi:undecaprenyl-diphosphatase
MTAVIDQLNSLDKELFLVLNGMYTSWLDPVVYRATHTVYWIPFYLFLLYQIIKEYKMMGVLVLSGVALTIILSDQITTGLMKPYFARLRPSHEPSLEGMVHLVNNYKGAMYGFASSHAANTFGTAAFLYLLFRKSKPWMGWLFLWATLVSYTRIYLGVHYPADIVGGGLVGILCGWIAFKLFGLLRERIEKRKTPSIP